MTIKKLSFTCFSLLIYTFSNAQIEGAYLNTKDFNAFGFGAHLNFAVPVSDGDYVTTEAGLYYFKDKDNHMGIFPLLLGYRHTIDGSGTGLFVEALAGYTLGGTNIQKYDASGQLITDGNGKILERGAKGVTGGLASGYTFSGRTPFTLALRYERVFVSKDPGLNLASLRFTWPLFGGKREE